MLRNAAICFLFLALLHCSVARNANSGEYPSQAAVYMPGNRFGEGVVMNRNHLLTVAANVFDPVSGNRLAPNTITIRAGAININANVPALMAVIRVFAHEGYNRFTGENNVAVLRTQLDFAFDPLTPIPFLAFANIHNRIIPETVNYELVGWNAPPNNINMVLQVIAMPVMNRQICNSQLTNPIIQGRVFQQHICVGVATINPAVCNNNPGAGFYFQGQLVGLLSSGRQCNTANSPGIVVQTRYFTEWINRQFLREDNPSAGPVPPPTIN